MSSVVPARQAAGADADVQLANGFAARVAAWAQHEARARKLELARDAVQRIYRAAWHASHATSQGHVCASLPALAAEDGQAQLRLWEETLLGSGVVGTPDDPRACPLVLDSAGRLYLHKFMAFELAIARRMAQTQWQPPPPTQQALDLLSELFAPQDGADWQKLAAALALLRPVTIISGGPGTGKTTTVANILACLLASQPGCRIALAAPTGKAAARMLEALNARAASIPPALLARFPRESYTVHRLLGVTPAAGVFRHNAQQPLPVDVLVVDEASMLDLALAARLFDAVPPSARIILLGDKDQLAAVEAGAVFHELSANPGLSPAVTAALSTLTGTPQAAIVPPVARGPGVADAAVWLTRNYRFGSDSAIGQLAALVVAGDAPGTLRWLQGRDADPVLWQQDEGDELSASALQLAVDGYASYARAVHASEQDPATVLQAFDEFRVLCATRQGARGVAGLNQVLSEQLRERLPAGAPGSAWYPGRPVIILRNDYTLKLFNGDIGIALRNAQGELVVMFPDRDAGVRAVGIARLPEHDSAWAMTVHRSQGSEFRRVMTVLPGRESRVVTRELLYTAITRAREALVLAAHAGAVNAAVATRTERLSGLSDRLAQFAAAQAAQPG